MVNLSIYFVLIFDITYTINKNYHSEFSVVIFHYKSVNSYIFLQLEIELMNFNK